MIIALGRATTKPCYTHFVSSRDGQRVLPFYRSQTVLPMVFRQSAGGYLAGYTTRPKAKLGDAGDEDNDFLFGFIALPQLLRVWRTMKLIEGLPLIGPMSLVESWHASASSLDVLGLIYVRQFGETFERSALTRDLLEPMRKRVLNLLPDEDVFATLMNVALKDGASEVLREFHPFIRDGLLPELPQVRELYAHYRRTSSPGG